MERQDKNGAMRPSLGEYSLQTGEIAEFIKEMDKENRKRKSRFDPLVPELGLRAMLESRLLLT